MSLYEFAKQVDVFVLFTLIYLVVIMVLGDVAVKLLIFIFDRYDAIKKAIVKKFEV